jgi:hypothetical protein
VNGVRQYTRERRPAASGSACRAVIAFGSCQEQHLSIPEAVVLPYEWITESRNHRRFSVPAAVVNKHGQTSASDE